jgi:hypothetical protein
VITCALVLPTPRALLGQVSLQDPVADLRKSCLTALAELPPGRLVVLAPPVSEANAARGVTEPVGHRLARHLLGGVPLHTRLAGRDSTASARALVSPEPTNLLVMADGSARRDTTAPGHFHPHARDFDAGIESALRSGDADALAELDPELGGELWCEGVPAFRALGEVSRGRQVRAEVSYADAPFGVAWWVARWDLSAP